ncbi:MAG: ABC transporter ATP-binding protein [Acetobacteraceae bacterium]|nr:ABC transporter ATP-binding protein [Acetobacteraceae bacterium]
MSLAVEHLHKSFGGLRVVEDVTFATDPQAITGLIGPNGAGKSTLFALITGYQRPDSGSVRFGATSMRGLSASARARHGVARTFQIPRPFRHLSVRQNLMAAGPRQPGEHPFNLLFRRHAVARRERELEQRADAMLAFLGLEAVTHALSGTLSGGQLKLLELGRALMTEPRYILLDEPFAGVNPVLIEQIAARIRTLAARGTGFLIVEHNLPALAALACHLLVMDRGRLIAAGSPDTVLADRAVQDAYIGGAA